MTLARDGILSDAVVMASEAEQSTEDLELADIRQVLTAAQQQLIDQRDGDNHWTGQLAASALSTATAISALSMFARASDSSDHGNAKSALDKGLGWLDAAQNEDGGFGDTDRSPSNIASSFLAIAAWHLGDAPEKRHDQIARAQDYIDSQGGWDGLKQRYGRDKTFVVPILSNCALAGLVPWSRVPSLPFELAAFPQSMYRFLQMPVVSYAVPALVAIGQARFLHAGTWNPAAWISRSLTRRKTIEVLLKMQPESGGYLEATPLTSFVLMNLCSIGLANHAVCRSAVQFLLKSQLEDGSWPIDENLATWVTSLSIGALAHDKEFDLQQVTDNKSLDWLLSCQHHVRHPFTGADPGGWGWTDLSGAVPDADDTPAAMIALSEISKTTDDDRIAPAAVEGAAWLLGLQNRDGGWPTFCRGWGKLPFDRSGNDLTAHALRALHRWPEALSQTQLERLQIATKRGFKYLERTQLSDGSWLPLWFGNHDCNDDENKVYGTARVLLAFQELGRTETFSYKQGLDYLLGSQNPDGGWGGGESVGKWLRQQGLPDRNVRAGQPIISSIEETAVAIEALSGSGLESHRPSIMLGATFLCDAVESGRCQHPWPIGFYFAKLWYHEKLYPLVFTIAALGKALTALTKENVSN